MFIKLTHPFLRKCIDHVGLLKDCYKLNTFLSRMEKQSERKATSETGEIDEEIRNKYKGDCFELFVEAFIRVFGADMLIGLDPESYDPIESDDDYGVDGTSTGVNGKIHTIQIKYRQANYILTANEDHLTNFVSLSFQPIEMGGFGVDPYDGCKIKRKRILDTRNLIIIHSGKEIHWEVKERMLKGVKEVNRKDIRNRVDDNGIFWRSFKESWDNFLLR
jgi:hypothetical protein